MGAKTLKWGRTAVGRLWQMAVAAGALLFSVLGDAAPGEVALLAIAVGLAVDLGTKRARLFAMERRRSRERREEPVVLPEEGATLATQKDLPRAPPEKMNVATWTVFAVMMAIALHAPGVDAELVRIAFSFFRTGLGAYGGGGGRRSPPKQGGAPEHRPSQGQLSGDVAPREPAPGPRRSLA